MLLLRLVIFLLSPLGIFSVVYYASNEEDLNTAINIVDPGDTIIIVGEDSLVKIFRYQFNITRSGTESDPITLIGHQNVRLSTPQSNFNRYALNITANYWVISDVYFQDSYSGIRLQGNYNKFSKVFLNNVVALGIYLESSSHNNFSNIELVGDSTYTSSSGIYLQSSSNENVFTGIIVRNANNCIYINQGSLNYFKDIEWNRCNLGCQITSGDSNVFDGGNLKIGSGFRIHSSSNWIQNIQFEYNPSMVSGAMIEIGGDYVRNEFNKIGGNYFYRERYHQRGQYSIRLNPATTAVTIENNIFLDEKAPWDDDGNPPIRINGNEILVQNNDFGTGDAKRIFELGADAYYCEFKNNQMHFSHGDPTTNICIFGYLGPGTANSTKIDYDNYCQNGLMTNIFDWP